jgi:hypothetical protein
MWLTITVSTAVGSTPIVRSPSATGLSSALALASHRLVEAGIEHDRAALADDRPDEEVERLRPVVRIATDEALRCFAVVVAVGDGGDLVEIILAHAVLPCEPARRRDGISV